MAEQPIGKITHYFDKLGVAVVQLEAGSGLRKGDQIHIHGAGTDFIQAVESLQIDHGDVEEVKPGDDFGLKVDQPVQENDVVYLAQ